MKRRITGASAAIAAALALAACSGGQPTGQSGAGGSLTFRLWDEQAAKAYEDALPAFEAATGIDVSVEVVPWNDYFTGVRNEIAAGAGPDVFWSNTNNYSEYAKGGKLVNMNEVFSDSERASWLDTAVSQYTVDGQIYGAPVITDPSVALYYNKELLDRAGVGVEELDGLAWDPAASSDSLRDIARRLTLDSSGRNAADPGFDPNTVVQYGYNAALDGQAMLFPYLGSNGASLQDADGRFTFASPEGEAAIGYLVDLVNKDHVAPSAADTNDNGDFSRDQFLQGKMALFQSGAYNLANVQEGAGFTWGLAPQPKGLKGAVTVGNSVVAVANAADASKADAQKKLLEWLAGPEGGRALGAVGVGFPANAEAQDSWSQYWSGKGVDVTVMTTKPTGTITAPFGAKLGAAMDAYNKELKEVFLGRVGVPEGVQAAQDAANKAVDE